MSSKDAMTQGVLTEEDIDHFMQHGYVVIKQAFSEEKSADWTKDMWTRLAMDPNDKKSWRMNNVHMPVHNRELVQTFAPKVWSAMCQLLGGEERIDPASANWGDSFIVNFGTEENSGPDKVINPYALDNWHVDGDFFVHFLDSPEQALLVIPIFSKIEARGGGTYISPDGIGIIARYLAEHPEGVLPTGLSFTPSTSPYATENHEKDPYYWSHLQEIKRCKTFVEVTGEIGDVFLLHPLMLHSRAPNLTRALRVITNPPVSLKKPFEFNRKRTEDYSPVELKTLRELGVDRLDYKITTERRLVTPKRVLIQQKMLEDERKRLAAQREESDNKLTSQVRALVVG